MKCVMGRRAVQRLYELCNETFSANGIDDGLPPSEAHLQRLRSVLDTIKPVDLGLNENELMYRQCSCLKCGTNKRRCRHSSRVQPPWPPPSVTYVHVYQCDEFSIGVFCLPTSAVIPLHDHPGMTVLSKILYGSLHVKAYDWLHPPHILRNPLNQTTLRLANLTVDTAFTAPCESSTLYPTAGANIHRFTAVTSCAVLDVIAPPYSTDTSGGRHISYYREYPYLSPLPPDLNGNNITDDRDGVWLEQVEKPDEFIVRGREYLGPIIIETDDIEYVKSFHASTNMPSIKGKLNASSGIKQQN